MFKKITLFLTLSLLVAFFIIPINALARIYLFDNKVEITGKIEEKVLLKYHMKGYERGKGRHRYKANGGGMKNPSVFKTHLHIDALWHIYNKEGGTTLDFYTLWEWFYDFAPDIRGDIHRGMYSRDRNRYQTPHGEEMVREMYLNYVSGPWTLRVGKQMIVWGETSLKRTADVINPLDIRSHMMGIDDWEDFRKGQWMFRGFYQTSFKNDLTFEIIWIPYDIEVMSMPPEGSVFNTSYTMGFYSQMLRRWKYDEPKPRGLHDSQGGFRLRGYNWDWDWTLMWYNGFDATPICVDWGQHGSGSYAPNTKSGWDFFNDNGLGGFNLFAGPYNSDSSAGIWKRPAFPTGRQFRYFRTDNFGATATKYFYDVTLFGKRIPLEAIMRIEFSYKKDVHFNKQVDTGGQADQWAIIGRTKRDILGYAIEIDKEFMPWFICNYNGQRSVNMTLGFFQDWIFNHDHNLYAMGYDRGYGDKNSTNFSLSINTDWMDSELYTMCSYAYNTSGNGFFWAFLQYGPGDHWRFVVLPRITWSNVGTKNRKHSGYVELSDSNNYVVFKIIYQF